MTSDSNDPPHDGDTKDIRARSRKLGQKLQDLYREVAEEAVPNEFLKLLEEADESEAGNRKESERGDDQ
jgi:hypothetical protein